jgi:hypothetical protein
MALKTLDIEASRSSLSRTTRSHASATLLRGQSLNASQTLLGQLIDEFALDRGLLEELQASQWLPLQQRIACLEARVAAHPNQTGPAIMLLIAMREANVLLAAADWPPPAASTAIPRRIIQFWDQPEAPDPIANLMETWKVAHADFAHVRLDDAAARQFLREHRLDDTLAAYRRAREPAQKADLIRLAYLAVAGGFYADADDRCLSHVGAFVPAAATFVAFQEEYGTLANNFLGAAPGHPVISLALRLATQAVNRGDSDLLWLATGPGLLTRAFCQSLLSGGVSTERPTTAILDLGLVRRHIGMHCSLPYKKSLRHWSRSSFGGAVRATRAQSDGNAATRTSSGR